MESGLKCVNLRFSGSKHTVIILCVIHMPGALSIIYPSVIHHLSIIYPWDTRPSPCSQISVVDNQAPAGSGASASRPPPAAAVPQASWPSSSASPAPQKQQQQQRQTGSMPSSSAAPAQAAAPSGQPSAFVKLTPDQEAELWQVWIRVKLSVEC